MKTYRIDIHPELKNVEVTVKNGAEFERCTIKGAYKVFRFTTNEADAERIRKFAVKHANDKDSNRGNWYAHCNRFAMDLTVMHAGKEFTINTYRPYGRDERTY